MEITPEQIKLWMGDLYIANKTLELQLITLEQENIELKKQLKNSSEVE